MSWGRLSPDRMYPAGVPDVEVRHVGGGDGVRLRVAISGPASGEPVILLHGWATSLYSFRFQLEDLARAGFRALAIDFRGHGLSDKPRGSGAYTREALVGDVVQVMRAMGIARAVIVGWSMGGAVALQLALERPELVSKLVLVNPAGLAAIPMIRASALLSPSFLDVLAPYLVPRWVVAHVLDWASNGAGHLTQRDIDEYWAPSRDGDYVRAARALLRDFDWSPATAETLARVRASTLVIVGGADRLVTGVGSAARNLTNARLTVFPGAGHIVHEERREEVDRAIVDFLRGESGT